MMNYLLLALLIVLAVAVAVVACDFYRLKKAFAHFKDRAERKSKNYVFLINRDFEVKATNYYDRNPERQDNQPRVLGNVLHCKSGCDSGLCGSGLSCHTCPIRFVINNAFKNRRDFSDVEATMELYDEKNEVKKTDVKVSGELVYANTRPYLMVSVASDAPKSSHILFSAS
jgi:hypothetical protein